MTRTYKNSKSHGDSATPLRSAQNDLGWLSAGCLHPDGLCLPSLAQVFGFDNPQSRHPWRAVRPSESCAFCRLRRPGACILMDCACHPWRKFIGFDNPQSRHPWRAVRPSESCAFCRLRRPGLTPQGGSVAPKTPTMPRCKPPLPDAPIPDACYSIIFETTPAPTVRPPSRIAKRKPSSIAIGAISSTFIFTLSPGITISTSPGNSTFPVTSVVRK